MLCLKDFGGFVVLAFVLCIVEPGYETQVLKAVRDLDEIREAFVVYGDYDIHIKIEVENLSELGEFNKTLRNLNGIMMTKTLIATIF
ncbi:MAG: Lrp/AsnC ligand binding domain-containing protein [Candidatus Methanofastidiosia archaeon]